MAKPISIEGDKKLQKKLSKMLPAAAKKAVRKGTRDGCKIIAKEAKSRAPVETGQLKRSIKVRAIKANRKSVGCRVVCQFKNKEGETQAVFYAPFVEFGHESPHGIPVEGLHFIEEATEATATEAGKVAVDGMWKVILGEAKK